MYKRVRNHGSRIWKYFCISMIFSQNHHYNYQPKTILTVQLSPMNMISNWMVNREKVCAIELNVISMSWHQTGNKLLVPSAHQLLNRSKLASKYNLQKNKDSSIYAKIVFCENYTVLLMHLSICQNIKCDSHWKSFITQSPVII